MARIAESCCWEFVPEPPPIDGIVHAKVVHIFKIGHLIHYVLMDGLGELHVRAQGTFFLESDMGSYASPDDALRDAADR